MPVNRDLADDHECTKKSQNLHTGVIYYAHSSEPEERHAPAGTWTLTTAFGGAKRSGSRGGRCPHKNSFSQVVRPCLRPRRADHGSALRRSVALTLGKRYVGAFGDAFQ